MKRIAISQRIVENDTYAETRDALDVRWAELFSELNLLPIIIPSHFNPIDYFKELKLDGLILSGGNDLQLFSDSKHSILRDQIETQLVHHCTTHKLPVFGVCRGMQLITDIYDGSLTKVTGHSGMRHELKANKASIHYEFLKDLRTVNSYHNYAVEKCPDGFIVSALAADGTIEAIENTPLKVFAQMWHPERDEPFNKSNLGLITRFFND